jgi:hypothetical protein
MRWRAQLSWRLPPRSSRWRWCLPELASSGATPAWRASWASDLKRSIGPISQSHNHRHCQKRQQSSNPTDAKTTDETASTCPFRTAKTAALRDKKTPLTASLSGRYWARTSDPQLVETAYLVHVLTVPRRRRKSVEAQAGAPASTLQPSNLGTSVGAPSPFFDRDPVPPPFSARAKPHGIAAAERSSGRASGGARPMSTVIPSTNHPANLTTKCAIAGRGPELLKGAFMPALRALWSTGTNGRGRGCATTRHERFRRVDCGATASATGTRLGVWCVADQNRVRAP